MLGQEKQIKIRALNIDQQLAHFALAGLSGTISYTSDSR